MNKFFKICFAILGGINTAFSLVIPIFIALLIIENYPDLGGLNQWIILMGGYLSAVGRAISIWIE